MSAVWTDPEFDESQHGAYYARATEIPTARECDFDAFDERDVRDQPLGHVDDHLDFRDVE